MDVLTERGHVLPEIVNESAIESVDSLSPYPLVHCVAYMVFNCSFIAATSLNDSTCEDRNVYKIKCL